MGTVMAALLRLRGPWTPGGRAREMSPPGFPRAAFVCILPVHIMGEHFSIGSFVYIIVGVCRLGGCCLPVRARNCDGESWVDSMGARCGLRGFFFRVR